MIENGDDDDDYTDEPGPFLKAGRKRKRAVRRAPRKVAKGKTVKRKVTKRKAAKRIYSIFLQ